MKRICDIWPHWLPRWNKCVSHNFSATLLSLLQHQEIPDSRFMTAVVWDIFLKLNNPHFSKMAASFKTVWFAATCLVLLLICSLVSGRKPLVPSMDSKRFFTKLHQYVTSEGKSLQGEDNVYKKLFLNQSPICKLNGLI